MPTARKTTTTDTIPGEIVQQKDWASEPIERVLIEARRRIGAVRKSERNAHFNFHFRGIDNVVNAAVPVFNDLGVLVTPVVKELSARGGNAIVWVDYWFHGPKGDTLVVPMVGEQSETTKALSIAWRTALIQTLNLPTDETDPDGFAPANVTAQQSPRQALETAQVYVQDKWSKQRGEWNFHEVSQEFWRWTNFQKQISDATAAELREFADQIEPKVDDYSTGEKP